MNSNTLWSRRQFLRVMSSGAASLPVLAALGPRSLRASDTSGAAAIEIGPRRELFVDNFLIERLTKAELTLHKPVPREVVFVCDANFEASQCVPLAGDQIAWTVKWKGNPDLSANAARPIRLRFLLHAADLFSMMFRSLGDRKQDN